MIDHNSSLTALKQQIQKHNIKLVIYDFDGVIFDLCWNHQETPHGFLNDLYDAINKIDSSIIQNKTEFITRLFPYPEINEIGLKYGRAVQLQVKKLYQEKETAALDLAVPNQEIIQLIKTISLPQAVWSNNCASTIEYLLKQAAIDHKISAIASLDKVIRAKPQGEGLQLIKKIHPNINHQQILFVGDSLISDQAAARNTGIRFYHYQKRNLGEGK